MFKFFAYINRMKYIKRWSLMRSVREENIMEHSQQVAVLAHTLALIENKIYGGKLDVFNAYNMSYVQSITGQSDIAIKVANSIWFKEDPYFTVKDAFLQTNADYYNAAAYKSPFDNQTLADINGWVSNKTDGMIDKILDDISKDAIMYLINAVLFDAEWSYKFEEEQDEYFTCADGRAGGGRGFA